MFSLIFSNFLYILSALVTLVQCKTEWIDPFSMDDDPTIRTECNCPTTHSSSIVASHYVRTISLLLNSLRYEKSLNTYKAHYEVNLHQEDYDFIRSFLSSSMEDSEKWNKVDRLFTSMFQNTEDTYFTTFLTWKDYLSYTLRSHIQEIGVTVGIVFLMWFLYKAMNAKITLSSVLKYLAFTFYLIDFIYTWIYMLKEKELEQLLHVTYTVPPECDVKKMGWTQYFSYISHTFVGKDKCQEYHKIKDIDIFWSVSPSQVFGTQIGNMVLAPAEKIGHAFGKLTSAVMDKSAWYLMLPTLLMMPILLFGLLLAGCVFLSFITGRGFSFNIFHIFQFAFGKSCESTSANDLKPQQINLVVPNLPALSPGGKRKRLRLKEEKKTSIQLPTSETVTNPVPAIKQDVEEFQEGSSSETDLSFPDKNKHFESEADASEYEVIC